MNVIPTDGLVTTFLHIPSVPFTNGWGGGDGIPPIFMGADYQQKTISATIELMAYDYLDYQLLRDELYGIFGFNKTFYVVDNRQPGKRHRVILDSDFMPERHNPINGTATIPFITEKLPFAESINTTLAGITDYPYRGIPKVNMSELVYIHTSNLFNLYNAGNQRIHPYRQELKITISDVVDSTDFLQLKNITNGSTFRTTEAVSDSQTIVLDGPNVTSNGLQYYRNTNHQFIELEPGWNEFEITGATSAKSEFDFRLYFN